jgi:hypothetical protein
MNGPNLSAHSIVVASSEQLSSDLADETVILNLADSTYYGLDSVGTRIWSLVQEPKQVREIVDTLVEEYEVEPDRCERDVLALLDDLMSHSLVAVRDAQAA